MSNDSSAFRPSRLSASSLFSLIRDLFSLMHNVMAHYARRKLERAVGLAPELTEPGSDRTLRLVPSFFIRIAPLAKVALGRICYDNSRRQQSQLPNRDSAFHCGIEPHRDAGAHSLDSEQSHGLAL